MTAQADFEGYVFRYGAVPPVIIDKTLASADVSTLPPGRWAQLRDGQAYHVRSAIALSNGRPSPPLSSASLFNAAYRGQAADIVGMAPYTAGLRRPNAVAFAWRDTGKASQPACAAMAAT